MESQGQNQPPPKAQKFRIKQSRLFDVLFLMVAALIGLFGLLIVYDFLLLDGKQLHVFIGVQIAVVCIGAVCAAAMIMYVLSNRSRFTKTKITLQDEIAKSQTLVDSLGDGVISINKDGIIEFINPQTLKIFSTSTQLLMGKYIGDAIQIQHADGRPVPLEARPFKLALTTGKVAISDRYFYVRPDRARIAVAISAAPIVRNGKVNGVVMTFRDITENREIEKTKDDFVAMTSHQLRTPLSAINWFTEMLLSNDAGELNENQKMYMQEIHDSNTRLIELVDELLDISRVDIGKFKVDPEPTDITELTKRMVLELQGEMKRKNVQITQNYAADIPKDTLLDKHLMWIIIQNFLTNAIKYTFPNDVIELKIEMSDQENLPIGYWADKELSMLISVTDHGMGIPKDQQDKIFTKLFRADNATMSAITGNGLGLYLVKAIIEQNGGKVWFVSEQNKGSTFYVNLPHTGMKPREGSKRIGETTFDPFTTPGNVATSITNPMPEDLGVHVLHDASNQSSQS